MAATVGIRALKQNASEVVGRVAAGESITVTDRGRPVARIVPLGASPAQELVAAGLARPPLRPLTELPEPVVTGDLSSALQQSRAEERY